MREHPILFSSEMVLAILAGRKTQTRRVMKPQPTGKPFQFITFNVVTGDRLWVREKLHRIDGQTFYSADGHPLAMAQPWAWKRRELPSIHMPRWASRITLEIINVRVERVQDIGENDAEREGVEMWCEMFKDYSRKDDNPGWARDPRYSFQTLWDSINAERGFGWDVNPWVWVIEFKKVESA